MENASNKGFGATRGAFAIALHRAMAGRGKPIEPR